jgi:putative endonuclease
MILEKNWRHARCEVDIIATQNDIIVFVEVKTRTNSTFGYPEEAVTESKQKKLAEAAEYYIQHVNHKGEIRFDIISILFNRNDSEIIHLKDAFFPSA